MDNFNQLASWGMSFFPVAFLTKKKPLLKWKMFQSRHPTKADIKRWSEFQPINIGVVTGKVSGIVVLDIDSDEGFQIASERGLPFTPKVKTTNGHHYYFKHPGGVVKNFVRKLPGMDFRGDGGYVLGPPSTHPSGIQYEWIVTPDEVPFAEMPEWLKGLFKTEVKTTERVRPLTPKGTHKIEAETLEEYGLKKFNHQLQSLTLAPNGARNNTLFNSALKCGSLIAAGALDRHLAEDSLTSVAHQIGLPKEEIKKTIESGIERGLNNREFIPHKYLHAPNNNNGVNNAAYEGKYIEGADGASSGGSAHTCRTDTFTIGTESQTDDKSCEETPQSNREDVDDGKEILKAEEDYIRKIQDFIYDKNEGNGSIKYELIQDKVARKIQEEYDICCTVDDKGNLQFYLYTDNYWQPVTKQKIKRLFIEWLFERSRKTTILNNIVDLLSIYTAVPSENLNTRSDLFPMENGVFDLNNYNLLPHDKKFYFTYKAHYSFDDSATCPEFDKNLSLYAQNKSGEPENEHIMAVHEIMGAALTGKASIHKIHFWLGGGRNGKGTVVHILDEMIPPKLIMPDIKPDLLNTPFYLNNLIGKRFAYTGDLKGKLPNIDVLKKISGGDKLNTERKFLDSTNFNNQATWILNMNKTPQLPSFEDLPSFFTRVHMLSWDYRILNADNSIEEYMKANELSGIFNQAIKGLRRLRENKKFTESPKGIEKMRIWIGGADMFTIFITEECVVRGGRGIFKYQLWEEYGKWMTENAGAFWQQKTEDYITTQPRFSDRLRELHDIEVTYKPCSRKGTMAWYSGIDLRKKKIIRIDKETGETFIDDPEQESG